jgi:hypothetical protein
MLNHYIEDISLKGNEYRCIVPIKTYDFLKKTKMDLKFLCLLILGKNCKFFDRSNLKNFTTIDDYHHILEIPVNKYEKIEIPVYTLFVNNCECFTFQMVEENQ